MIREATPTELGGRIEQDWAQSLKASPFATHVIRARSLDFYFRSQRRHIRAMLNRSTTLVDERDGLIAGWACIEGDVLHYVYVRYVYRGLGVARALFAAIEGVTTYSHHTKNIHPARLPKGLTYDPYTLFR